MRTDLMGEHFDSVLDVGGNVGDFAEQARTQWRDALITSFEPVPRLAEANRQRAGGRWIVEMIAASDVEGQSIIHYCENQHSASTMQEPGSARGLHFGIRDRFTDVVVTTKPLDNYLDRMRGRCLIKIDVEGHEMEVLHGAQDALHAASAVVIEVQNDPTIFLGAPNAYEIDVVMSSYGLRFAGVADSFAAPGGKLLQFDGVWRRDSPRHDHGAPLAGSTAAPAPR